MLTIFINQKPYEINSPQTLSEILKKLQYGHDIAVAVNQQFVPRSTYADFQLVGGERIDIITPMQGG